MPDPTATTPPDLVTPPLPNPGALLERARACRAELHRAKSASALRGLYSLDEEKTNLRVTAVPTGFEGVGRPDGPAPGDKHAPIVTPAVTALAALDRYDAAIAAADALSVQLRDAFSILDAAVRAAEGEGDGEILDAGRIEALTHTRRQLDAARLERAGLVGDLEDARPLRRSFVAKAERLRDAAIAVLHERIVHDIRAALDGERTRVEAIRARAPEEVAPVRDLVARWAARLGQPVPLPAIRWPKGADPFAPPVLEEAE